jgi:hypothetical protein
MNPLRNPLSLRSRYIMFCVECTREINNFKQIFCWFLEPGTGAGDLMQHADLYHLLRPFPQPCEYFCQIVPISVKKYTCFPRS